MSQHTGSADDEGIELTYSSLLPGKRLHTSLAALPHNGRLAPGEPEPVRASRGAWPYPYHRVLTGTFLGALLALGVLLGMAVSDYAASRHSLPSSVPMLSRPGVPTTLVTPPGAVSAVSEATAAVDARFAIVTLGIGCLPDLCNVSQYVPAGQRVYALHGGWSCTTLSAAKVVDHHEQYVYCRLDQPNVFTATFDGAPFDCVGSRLGCHFVVQVETTNGR